MTKEKFNEKMEYLGCGVIIVAFGAMVLGGILMIIGSLQKYGWVAAFADDSLTSLFAVTTLWEVTTYRVGFIMCAAGSATLAIFRIYMELAHPDPLKKFKK